MVAGDVCFQEAPKRISTAEMEVRSRNNFQLSATTVSADVSNLLEAAFGYGTP